MALIVLGTINSTKATHLAWLVDGLDLQCRSVEGLPPPPAESGRTLAENARLKALYYSRVANGLAIASDGGLQIPALGDRWDPLLTHRFAGEATEEARARTLLALMEGLRGDERRAFFVEAVALADRGALLGEWEAPGEEALVIEAMPERLIPNFWAGSLLYYPRLRKSGLEVEPVLFHPKGERPFAPTSASAWARLRPIVQAHLRRWLEARSVR